MTQAFLKTWALESGALNVAKLNALWNKTSGAQGRRQLLETLCTVRTRKDSLKKCSAATCRSCGVVVMREVFFMVAELVLTEVAVRSDQVQSLLKSGALERSVAVELIQMYVDAAERLSTLVKSAEKKEGVSHARWSRRIELVFRVMVQVINETMARATQVLKN
jgi:hypothetical protein